MTSIDLLPSLTSATEQPPPPYTANEQQQLQDTSEKLYYYNIVDEKYFTNSLRPEIKIYFDNIDCYPNDDKSLNMDDLDLTSMSYLYHDTDHRRQTGPVSDLIIFKLKSNTNYKVRFRHYEFDNDFVAKINGLMNDKLVLILSGDRQGIHCITTSTNERDGRPIVHLKLGFEPFQSESRPVTLNLDIITNDVNKALFWYVLSTL